MECMLPSLVALSDYGGQCLWSVFLEIQWTCVRLGKESFQELGELKAQILTLNRLVDSGSERADAAIQEKENLQAELLCIRHNDSTNASCKNGADAVLSPTSYGISWRPDEHDNTELSPQDTEAALWQALQKALEESASFAARAAEASASVKSFESQLKQVRGEQQSLLQDVAVAMGTVFADEPEDICPVSLIVRTQEMKSELDRIRDELQSARVQLHKEQATSLQVR